MIPLAPILNHLFCCEKQVLEEQRQQLLKTKGYRTFMALDLKELVPLRIKIRRLYVAGLYSERVYDLLCYTLRQRLFVRLREQYHK